MFSKILIANRGEIACRVMKTARRMGLRTVAVYSEADRRALHVRMADEAVCIGPAAAALSYLSPQRIIEACRATGAQALHPGYGFLSENADFCAAVEHAGIAFIGPDSATLRRAADKIASKRLAREAGIATLAWSLEDVADAEHAVRAAQGLGYPVIVKAAAAGGGRGLRIAADDTQCRRAFRECGEEASAHFDDARVFIEKLVPHARHVEVQVLADHHGGILSLGERECSIQRRHQKMAEEAPSALLDDAARASLADMAVRFAKKVGYRSAGTVEFLCDREGNVSFLEMNARLQVEHPVTEMITGLDLVEQMIRIAAGEKLTLSQAGVQRTGWAIEARICAEDPSRGFVPSAGRLVQYLPPAEQPGVRVDSGTYEGDDVSVHYDSMIAKVITSGATREEAIARLRLAVDGFRISGVSHNLDFLSSLTRHPRFLAGAVDTDFIDEEYGRKPAVIGPERAHIPLLVCVAAAIHARHRARSHRNGRPAGHGGAADGLGATVLVDREPHPVRITEADAGFTIRDSAGEHRLVSDWTFGQPRFYGTLDGAPFCVQVERDGPGYRLNYAGMQCEALALDPRAAALYARMPRSKAANSAHLLFSPMPGLVTEVAVEVGNEVKAGQRLAVIEAMKMENVLKAGHDCVVEEILVNAGESVAAAQPLIRFRQAAQATS